MSDRPEDPGMIRFFAPKRAFTSDAATLSCPLQVSQEGSGRLVGFITRQTTPPNGKPLECRTRPEGPVIERRHRVSTGGSIVVRPCVCHLLCSHNNFAP